MLDESRIKQGLDALAARDPDVARGLALVGYPPPRTRPAGLPALVQIVAGQQISKEAAAAIYARLEAACPGFAPEALRALGPEGLRALGLSRPKAAYILALAAAAADGRIAPERWADEPDEAVIGAITALKGFGRWSAEVYLIFALGRPDVFPADDLALVEALRRLRGLADRPKPAEARALSADWAPWRSAASLFLWHYYRGAPA